MSYREAIRRFRAAPGMSCPCFCSGLLMQVFHELVHVIQYEKLGLVQFANKYVRGFLNGGSYDGIPLEMGFKGELGRTGFSLAALVIAQDNVKREAEWSQKKNS